MTKSQSPKAVKVLENGNYAVQWKGSKKWFVIDKSDKILFEYIVFYMVK
jgi:hypothetical protein